MGKHLVEIGLKSLKSDLGVRRHLYPDPVGRRRSLARKRRPGAKANQVEAHVPLLNDGHGRRVTARDGCYP